MRYDQLWYVELGLDFHPVSCSPGLTDCACQCEERRWERARWNQGRPDGPPLVRLGPAGHQPGRLFFFTWSLFQNWFVLILCLSIFLTFARCQHPSRLTTTGCPADVRVLDLKKRKRQKQWSRSRHGSGSQTGPTCLQSWRLRRVASLELVSHCDQVSLDQGRRRRVCLTHNLDQGGCWQKKPFV